MLSLPKVILAPLAGCADLSFRLICREHGAEFAFYEMADAHSLVMASHKKTLDIHQEHPKDFPIAAQILGAEPKMVLKGAQRLLELHPKLSFIDLNAACPVRKVVKKKAGAYLIHKPKQLFEIIKTLANNIELPITIKLRTGYLKRDIKHLIKVAKGCEKSGAQALFVHGRTQAQLYHGDVDYDSIKAVKEAVGITVFGSGNIFTPQDAKKMLDKTGCDGVMVARGAFGNPWIFEQISNYLSNGTIDPEPSLTERLKVLIRHLQYVEKYKLLPPHSKVGYCRKIMAWYLKGFHGSAAVRGKINSLKTFAELYGVIDELLQQSDR